MAAKALPRCTRHIWVRWLPQGEKYSQLMSQRNTNGPAEQGFDCDDPLGHFHIRTDYYNYFKKWYPNGPQFTPEFQGGAFDRKFTIT